LIETGGLICGCLHPTLKNNVAKNASRDPVLIFGMGFFIWQKGSYHGTHTSIGNVGVDKSGARYPVVP